MQLSELLRPSNVCFDVFATSKTDLLKALAKLAGSRLRLPSAQIMSALFDRERLGSTAIGSGFAIPHAKLKGLDHPFVLCARLAKECEFEAPDGEPVDFIFLLLVPETTNEVWLQLMSQICRALRDPDVASAIRHVENEQDIVPIIGKRLAPMQNGHA